MRLFAGITRRAKDAWRVLPVLFCLALTWSNPTWAADKSPSKADQDKTSSVMPQFATGSQADPDVSPPPPASPAGQAGQAQRPAGSREMSTTVKQPADFNECVRLALVQSPMLVKSALEIESKRLDVQDAWATFIPTISINTTYWFSQPQNSDGTTNKPYTISFSTDQWNPLVSGFDVKAKGEMASMAILGHLKVIGEGLFRLASDFLQLSAIDEQKAVVRQKMDLAKSNLEFFKTRLGLGQATQLDVRIAETKIKMAKAEDDKVESSRAMVMDDVKFLLGIPFINKLDVNVEAAKKQIMGNFTVADVTDEKVRAHSFELRIAEYEKSLQRKNIGLSYVKLLPTFGFTFQTVSAFSSTTNSSTSNSGFYFYPGLNINMPLDYWTKGRDIARQYKKLDQAFAATKAKEFELMASVQKSMTDYQSTNSDLSLESSRMELAKLQSDQTEYRYKTGQTDYDKFVADRAAYFDAWQKMLLAQVKRDVALLTLKNLSGDLENQYIDVTAWEK